ncbi:MAG TPA: hypothetical protein VFN11_16250, partial [Ktedonobacterales bacterium]|nr:hypothetical protein [Ktedonobacterales bacterium]
CRNGKKSVTVDLQNLGQDSTGWQAQKNNPLTFQISINPQDGSLDAGGSTTVTLTYNPGIIPLNNTINFVPDNDQAGQPAVLSYTAPACFGRSSSSGTGTVQQIVQPSSDKHKKHP